MTAHGDLFCVGFHVAVGYAEEFVAVGEVGGGDGGTQTCPVLSHRAAAYDAVGKVAFVLNIAQKSLGAPLGEAGVVGPRAFG